MNNKKLVHIASHQGNIGDLLNHIGFYEEFEEIFGKPDIVKIEMRDFYYSSKNRRVFDKAFAEYVNTFDFCIIGGGGFFDVRWENSASGTTLDIGDEFIENVTIPVIINAMGYHEISEDSELPYEFFGKFLHKITGRDNWLITVRNDGSHERLSKRFCGRFDSILKVPDNAFWTRLYREKKDSELETVGMCITNDLFSEHYNGKLDAEMFNKRIAALIEEYLASGRRVILFNNTPADVMLTAKLLSMISEENIRKHLIVAPYNTESEVAIQNWAKYCSMCDCIVGMRFHSVISAINCGIRVIALAGHRQIEALMEDLDMKDYCVKVNGVECVDRVKEKVEIAIAEKESYAERYEKVYSYLRGIKEEYRSAIIKIVNDGVKSNSYE